MSVLLFWLAGKAILELIHSPVDKSPHSSHAYAMSVIDQRSTFHLIIIALPSWTFVDHFAFA